jgi:outer membrane murein-binding lipoprotein Lpp
MKIALGAVVALLMSLSLAGCSEETPAVCTSVDDLRASVQSVRDVDVTSSGGLGELEDAVAGVKSDLADVRDDAADEFSSQIDTVQAGIAELERSLRAAQDAVSPDTLRAAGSALRTLANQVQSLIDDIRATC